MLWIQRSAPWQSRRSRREHCLTRHRLVDGRVGCLWSVFGWADGVNDDVLLVWRRSSYSSTKEDIAVQNQGKRSLFVNFVFQSCRRKELPLSARSIERRHASTQSKERNLSSGCQIAETELKQIRSELSRKVKTTQR